MSKRRISHQQLSRINKKQNRYQESTQKTPEDIALNGLVISRFSRHALIETETKQRIHCAIRPNLGDLVAGDRVLWQQEGHHQGVIVSCYPRTSVLGRPDKRGQIKPIAANITQVIIVVAPKPEISLPLLDSYLVMAEYLQLEACIVLNKMDLATLDFQETLFKQYDTLGYSVLLTGRGDAKGYQRLQETLKNHINVFVGQSGVGKSSLISELLPLETRIQTGAISERTELGRHTTSNSCLYHLPAGGALIDSPGVREFGLWHMPISDIAKGYREFRPYIQDCKYRNCTHQNTQGCAILLALQNNQISSTRYENYVKIALQFAK